MTKFVESKRTLFAAVFVATLTLAGCGALTGPMLAPAEQPAPPQPPVTESHTQNAPHNLANADSDNETLNSSSDTQSTPVVHNTYPGE